MKKQSLFITLFLLFLPLLSESETSLDIEGKRKKSMDLVSKALAFYQKNGQEEAFKSFNDPKGAFVDGEYYIFVFDFNGVTLAHGTNQKLIGKNQTGLVDANGNTFVLEFIRIAKEQGNGWVDYQWSNPTIKKMQNKSTYIVRIPGVDLLIGCGFYRD